MSRTTVYPGTHVHTFCKRILPGVGHLQIHQHSIVFQSGGTHLYSLSWPPIGSARCFTFCQSRGYAVLCSEFVFSWWQISLTLFHMLTVHSGLFFPKVPVKNFCLFFYGVILFLYLLILGVCHIFWILVFCSFYVTWMPFYSLACLFILFMTFLRYRSS